MHSVGAPPQFRHRVVRRCVLVLPHLLLAAAGTVVLLVSLDYGWFAPGGRTQPGLFPGIAAVLLIACAGSEAVRAGVTRRQGGLQAGDGRPAEPRGEGIQERRLTGPGGGIALLQTPAAKSLAVLGVAAVIVLLSGVLGLLLSIAIALLGLLVGFERVSLLRAAVVTALAVLAMWLVFDYALNVPLPPLQLGR
ncbi:MAG: hypothetical protein GEU78_14510 [Actinobacteria bacterium]|nr:hypothetical protein [Actinomycetota bacterium]